MSLSVGEINEAARRVSEPWRGKKGGLIPILQMLQEELGYLPREALLTVSRELKIPASEIFGVATFYSQFHLKPRGRHIVRVCRGTACHVRGSLKILDRVKEITGVGENETTEDLRFTIEPVACLGACGLAPVMMVDTKAFGRLEPETVPGILDQFE